MKNDRIIPFPPISSSRSTKKRTAKAVRYNRGSSSRAVEPALGQEMPRAMGHFQVRKWSKPHRGFNKKALAHPSPRRSCAAKDLQRNASRKDFCAAKEIRELKSNPARRVPLRCVSRGRTRACTGISPQWEIPCEQMAKSPPGSLQESICSHSICLILEAYCP